MSVNSSSSNDSFSSYLYCYVFDPSSSIYLSFLITHICLVLSLCIFIIYHGLQQWSPTLSSTSAATMSHSDYFTYHLVLMELTGIFGCVACCCGIYRVDLNLLNAGNVTFAFAWFGETFFHVLTCLERYLAVVHPITYMKLRKERGVRIRRTGVGCGWLFCFTATGLFTLNLPTIVYAMVSFTLTVVTFFSLSVLWILIQSGPGEKGRGKVTSDQSKKRAFLAIMAILGVLILRFTSNVVWEIVALSKETQFCLIITSVTWFNLPSSLILPLLFLHRARKSVSKNNIK